MLSLSEENYRSLKCYADVRVAAFLLGQGPPRLPVLISEWSFYPPESFLAEEAARTGRTTTQLSDEMMHQSIVTLDAVLSGREEILFLGPPLDMSVEVWAYKASLDVQRREDGLVVVAFPYREDWDLALPALKQAVTAANMAREGEYGGRISADPESPMLIIDANQLREFYNNLGVYNHPDGPPDQPPPPCGLAVGDYLNNPGLGRDCQTLLAAKDTIRGSATLNWSVDTSISTWDGVTLDGTPSRVTELDLRSNQLTGAMPAGLSGLSNLRRLYLGGNLLSGCIPTGLRNVEQNDLESLSLPDCG